jgi:integrase
MPHYNLTRRPGSPNWYITWSERGRSRRYSTGTEDRAQAELVLAAFRLELARSPAEAGEVTLSAVLDRYLDEHARKLPSAPQAAIARDHLIRHFGTIMVGHLNAATFESYIAERRNAGVSDETISRELSVLRAALRRDERCGRLNGVPHVPALPRAEPRERWLTRAEAARLLRACRGKRHRHLALFVRLGLYTGARPGAILDLTWDRVDLDHRLIHFALPGRVHGRKRRACVPIEGASYTALGRAQSQAKTKHVIEWADRPVTSIKRAFARAADAAKLEDVTPGTLRHTAATWAALAGIDLHGIGALLGHSRPSTTARYAKYHPDYLRDVVRAVARGRR